MCGPAYADVKSSIKDFYNYKKSKARILLNLIETFCICLGAVKNWPKIQGKIFVKNMGVEDEKHEVIDCQS